MLPIPRSLDDVTPQWLTSAFRDAGILLGVSGRVVQATPVRIGQGYGFTGVIGRVRLRYEHAPSDLPGSLVAKLPMALDEEVSGFRKAQERDPARMRRHYERCAREVRFYREVDAPFVPRVYYSAADAMSQGVVLLLEDLGDGRQGDELQGCSIDDVARVIDALAPFHARYWDRNAPIVGFEPTRLDPVARQERYRHRLRLLSERYDHALSPDVLHIAKPLGTRLAAVAERLNGGPRTLIHGDLHLDNLLFDSSGHTVVILDWQTASLGPPASDVAQLIYGSLGVKARRSSEADLLDHYATLLSEHGVSDYSTADLRTDCDLALLLILAGTVGGLTAIDPNEMTARELALHENGLATDGRLVSALLDHKVERLLA